MLFLIDEKVHEFIAIRPSLALEHEISALFVIDFWNHTAMVHIPWRLEVGIFLTGVIHVATTL